MSYLKRSYIILSFYALTQINSTIFWYNICWSFVWSIVLYYILSCNIKDGWSWGSVVLTTHWRRMFPWAWVLRGGLIVLKLLLRCIWWIICTWELLGSILRKQYFLASFSWKLLLRHKVRSSRWSLICIHHAFIAFLAWHQFGDHRTVLLIDGGLIVVHSTTRTIVSLRPTMLARSNFW